MRILIVDDEPQILKATAKVLQAEHDVRIAASGKDALALLKKDPNYDAILMNTEMPDMNGWHLLATIKQHYPDLVPRIIFWSAARRYSKLEANAQATGNAFIRKPVDPGQLLEVIPLLVS